MNRAARRLQLLSLVAGGSTTRCSLCKASGWTDPMVATALKNAVTAGDLMTVGTSGASSVYGLTARGRRKLGGSGLDEAVDGRTMPATSLAEQALGAVRKAPAGIDSAALAERLAATPEEIEHVLSAAVMNGELVSCGVLRGGARCVHYRTSAGSPRDRDWRKSLFRAAATKPDTPALQVAVEPPPRGRW